MYRFYIRKDDDNEYHYSEMCRVFLKDEEFEIIPIDKRPCSDILGDNSFVVGYEDKTDRDFIKRELYDILSDITGLKPEWGTLTGVRPLKPAKEILQSGKSMQEMRDLMKQRYLIKDSKLNLISEIAEYQNDYVTKPASGSISIYVGIPFCPTRCDYCSFASIQSEDSAIKEYLLSLYKEIEYTGDLFRNNPSQIESIYIGGGTPTSLSACDLSKLINKLGEAFDIKPANIEFTIEAGRPDTITEDKLAVIKESGVRRISINPQSMKDDTLRIIGRNHSSQDIKSAFIKARASQIEIINADLIAGLPNESLDDFKDSLDEIIELGAENITIHTLSVKRGSHLHENDPYYYRRDVDRVGEMLSYAHKSLKDAAYHPYYVYRQKHQIGAHENVGYCLKNTHSVYNIRIMEDKQSIIALGAGAITKLYYPAEDRIDRIANVSNPEIYNKRIDDMIKKKQDYFGG